MAFSGRGHGAWEPVTSTRRSKNCVLCAREPPTVPRMQLATIVWVIYIVCIDGKRPISCPDGKGRIACPEGERRDACGYFFFKRCNSVNIGASWRYVSYKWGGWLDLDIIKIKVQEAGRLKDRRTNEEGS